MKRKLEEIDDTLKEGKRQRLKSTKRSRSPFNPSLGAGTTYNQGGASDDETEEIRVVKKMVNSLRLPVVTRRCIPFQKIDRSNVPSYIN
jgi:hypothetical protein